MSSTGADYIPQLQILPSEDSIWKSPHNIYELKCLPLALHDSTHCVNMYYCQTRYIFFAMINMCCWLWKMYDVTVKFLGNTYINLLVEVSCELGSKFLHNKHSHDKYRNTGVVFMLQHIDLLTDKICSKPHSKGIWTYTSKHTTYLNTNHSPSSNMRYIFHPAIWSNWNVTGNHLTCDTRLFIEKFKPLFWKETMSNFVWKFSSHNSRKIDFIPLPRRCSSLAATYTQQGSAVLNWSKRIAEIVWVLWLISLHHTF